MKIREKIFFHGAGLVTALGDSVTKNLTALQRSSAMTTNFRFSYLDELHDTPYHTISNPDIEVGQDRIYQIIDHIIEQVLESSNFTEKDLCSMALFVGSTSFDIFSVEQSIKNLELKDENIAEKLLPPSRLTEYISQKYKIQGPIYSINTACTSSANALMYAAEFVRRGDIDEALVLGLEFFNEITAKGFWALDLISQTKMRPFRADRDGLILGEGCSALILSKKIAPHNVGYISGANLGDAFSITACNSDGSTVASVIQQTLNQANISADKIVLVKAHATASLSNDEAEAAGLHQVFSTIPPVVALKPFIGHTLGACGVNELILFYQGIVRNQLPFVNKEDPAAECFGLNLFGESDEISKGYFLLNYFGFGGNNTALIIGDV